MQQTLEGWEKYLRSYLGHIRLLSEIPLEYSDIENLQSLIRALLHKHGNQNATDLLANDFPAVFLTYLSAYSAINTEAGYWEALAESIGLARHPHSLNWHKNYLTILGKYRLNHFEYSGARQYVTTIRIHGGIPAYSLPDFFEFLLLPSVEKIYWRDLPANELIKKAISGEFRFYGDRTVINFFEFSGDIGVNYLQECQQMVRDFKEKGFFEPTAEMNLPAYVVDAYEDFKQREEESRPGENAPKVLFDFYEKTFTLRLPKLFISPNLVENDLFWRIFIPSTGFNKEIPVQLVRSGINVFASDDHFNVQEPTSEIVVSLVSKAEKSQEGMAYRLWKVPVFPTFGKVPLMVWRNIKEQPTLLRWRQRIPAETLAIMLPSDCSVMVDGEEKCIGRYGNLPDAFSGWKLEVWDFSEANFILVERNNDFPWPPVPVSIKPPEVSFTGAEPFTKDKDPNGSLLFINRIPSLLFPLDKDSADLSKWKVILKSEGIEQAQFSKTFALEDVKELLRQEGNNSALGLNTFFDHIHVIGTFAIDIKGTFGFNQSLKFRVWPNLTILYLPNSIAAIKKEQVEFTIASTLDFECERLAGEESISIEKTVGLYKICVPRTIERIDLYLTIRSDAGLPIRVPIYIAIPGAKWLIGGINAQSQTENIWHHQEISLAVDLILQSQQPCLHLKVFGQEVDCDRSQLLLCDPTIPDNTIQVIHLQRNIMDEQTMYFDLSGIKNNLLQNRDISIFQLKAEIRCHHQNEAVFLPLVGLKRALEISNVDLIEIDGDNLKYRLTWHEAYPLRNRRALIWSVWQPWADSIENRIPDDARGVFEFSGYSLPPSYYRVAFYTAFPWEEKRKDNPDEGVFDLKKIDAQKKIVELTKILEEAGNNDFLVHFSLACIYQSEGFLENFQHETTWCRHNLSSASTTKAISFYDWLGKIDAYTQKAVAMKMRQPEMLELLFKNYEENHPLRKRYIDILTTIKIDLQNPKIAWSLLENSNNPLLEFRSFNSLIENEDEKIIGVILTWIDEGRLSIGNAVDILCKNPKFAFNCLEALQSHDSLAHVLIKKILNQCGNMDGYIKPGYRIITQAGVGTILNVFDNQKEAIDYLKEGTGEGILEVVLHDEISAELVEIDFVKKTIHFLGAEQLFICTKCNQFVSASQDKVVNEHNKIEHEGIGPAFRPIPSNTISFESDVIIEKSSSN